MLQIIQIINLLRVYLRIRAGQLKKEWLLRLLRIFHPQVINHPSHLPIIIHLQNHRIWITVKKLPVPIHSLTQPWTKIHHSAEVLINMDLIRRRISSSSNSKMFNNNNNKRIQIKIISPAVTNIYSNIWLKILTRRIIVKIKLVHLMWATVRMLLVVIMLDRILNIHTYMPRLAVLRHRPLLRIKENENRNLLMKIPF